MKAAFNLMSQKPNLPQIWKTYNDSMVFFLPLFAPKNIKFLTVSKPHIEFSFLQVCLDSGLINTFLFRNSGEKEIGFNNSFYMLFDRSGVTTNLKERTSINRSLHNIIVNSDYFENLTLFGTPKNKNNFTYSLYEMRMPEIFTEDAKIILKSRYSSVSTFYREFVRVKTDIVPSDSNPYGLYLSSNNMPYTVSSKGNNVKRELEKAINQSIPKDQEYYTKFRIEKEVFKSEEYII